MPRTQRRDFRANDDCEDREQTSAIRPAVTGEQVGAIARREVAYQCTTCRGLRSDHCVVTGWSRPARQLSQ
jgi:hypothetical protein